MNSAIEAGALGILVGATVLFCIAFWVWATKEPAPVPELRGPSRRYGKDDDGSDAWLAEYFERLEG